jgi:hypothetical protein
MTAIDYDAPEGQVRLLISDVGDTLILDDGQIGGYLTLNDGEVRLAAADALDAIASSETLVSKVIKTQDLSADGPAVAASLRAHADRLRDIAGQDLFDVVDTVTDLGRRPRGYLYPTVWGL